MRRASAAAAEKPVQFSPLPSGDERVQASDDNKQLLLKGVILAVITVFVGSSVAAVGKHLSGQVHVSTIVAAQYLICFLLTLPWLLRRGLRGLATQHPWQHLVRGVSGCGCFYAYYLALKHIPLVDASLLRNTAPLMVPMIVFATLGSAIPARRWPPILIGFVGIGLVLKPGLGISLWHLIGLASGLGLAVSMVSTQLLARSEPESRILFYYFFISLLAVLPFLLWNLEPIPVAALPWLLYIGVAMYFTFVLYTRAFSYVPAAILAPTSYFSVAFSGLWDWLIWDVVPGAQTVLGVLCVVLGGILVLRTGNQ